MRKSASGWKSLGIGAAAIAVFSVGMCVAADDSAAAPKMTVKEVMEKAHKGDTNLSKKVTSGKATKEETSQLLAYYKSMAGEEMPKDAPRGNPKDWKKRTNALVMSMEKVEKGDAAGMAEYKTAVDCRACHSMYRKMPARGGRG